MSDRRASRSPRPAPARVPALARVLPLLPPRFHAYAITQRGHGDSDRPPTG